MTKAELIERIARSRDLPPDISKKLIGQILAVAFDELAGYFARSRVTRSQSPRFTFPHFGTFTKKRRSARRGVNPRTLEPIQIEACNTIDFKASRELRETMNPGARAGEGGELTETPWSETSSGTANGAGAAPPSKTAKKKVKARAKTKASRVAVAGPGKRRLTPRDEETELQGLVEGLDHQPPRFEPAAGAELPASPMQRVTGRRRSRSRGTG